MIRLIIAEHVPMLRGALVALLQMEQDFHVVAETGRAEDILLTVLEFRPDVAVIDIDLPGTDGLEAVAKIRSCLPSCRLLIITGHPATATLLRALGVEVDGYLLKDALPSDLARAIRKVVAGQRVIDPQLTLSSWDRPLPRLTPREATILRLTAGGEDVQNIAQELHLSTGTVRNHLTAIGRKLGARNRVDAVRIAQENRLI
ncbi:response regulator transcription factor [Streptomyces sp. NBC_00059]|uniref:response regulator n=1 Tax=Streptomyces sp. NBC_00059 TaxID=2975635 RepID=UPI002251D942|nr:response regulator transcription factor [Streptomyces sp. NBC_00059]MCX5415083.1 response regulator transcription factor [Streptomyces sp. NBC_00059]